MKMDGVSRAKEAKRKDVHGQPLNLAFGFLRRFYSNEKLISQSSNLCFWIDSTKLWKPPLRPNKFRRIGSYSTV